MNAWWLTLIWIVLAVLGGLLFLWMVVFKLVSKLASGREMPCPASIGWLVDNPIRRRYMQPILDRVGIRAGEVVLEVGPGPGAFTLPAAQRLGPDGKLIAVDIQPRMIEQLKNKLSAAAVTNVETHVASAYEIPLADETVDRAFLVTVVPEIPDPVRALREIRRVLKPGGVLSITEEFMDPDYPRRITTRRWAESAGFVPADQFGKFWIYTLNFRKPA